MNYYIYILQSQKDFSYYIGFSKDPENRLEKHNNSKTGYTSKKKPWSLVHIEEFATKTEAIKREIFIKKQKSSEFIRQLIEQG